jgi:hypothetical protein
MTNKWKLTASREKKCTQDKKMKKGYPTWYDRSHWLEREKENESKRDEKS